jgi:hypothetical protein
MSNASGIAATDDRVLIAGTFGRCIPGTCAKALQGGTLIFGHTTLTATSGSDLFLASLGP